MTAHRSTSANETILASWHTDQGNFRARNEDSFFVDLDGGIFVVTDGVGGHAGGEWASQIAAEELGRQFQELMRTGTELTLIGLETCVGQAIRAIQVKYAYLASKDATLSKMACCVAFAVIQNDSLFFGRIGDCRIYAYENGDLQLLLKDESYVQELVDRNLLSEFEAEVSHLRHLITNCLSQSTPVTVNAYHQTMQTGTQIILTTDGVSDVLDSNDFTQTLDVASPDQMAQSLVSRALSNGSRDNLTCITMEYVRDLAPQDLF